METLASIIESILFISGKEVAIKDISEKLEITDKQVLNAAKTLQEKYGETSGINLLIFNKKLQFCSNPKNAEEVATVLNPIKERELSRSMLEVSAIVAYKQPVTRLEIEEIRGANSEYAVQNLLKLGIIEVVGRKDAVGKPVLFGTTDAFLKRFQISSLDELPNYEVLMEQIKLIHGNGGDNYLFRKDVYDASQDPENQQPPESLLDGIDGDSSNGNTNGNTDGNNDSTDDSDDDSDDSDDGPIPFDDEEIPDFLVGEDVEIIK